MADMQVDLVGVKLSAKRFRGTEIWRAWGSIGGMRARLNCLVVV
jgi:hypothetical protein